jgi:hypothetical protein
MTPGIWTHKHGSSQTAPYWVLSSECEVVVVGNYKFADSFTRYLHLGMHLEFCDTRRNHVAPRDQQFKRPVWRCQEIIEARSARFKPARQQIRPPERVTYQVLVEN